jgi:hypothetical protein
MMPRVDLVTLIPLTWKCPICLEVKMSKGGGESLKMGAVCKKCFNELMKGKMKDGRSI